MEMTSDFIGGIILGVVLSVAIVATVAIARTGQVDLYPYAERKEVCVVQYGAVLRCYTPEKWEAQP